MSEFSPLFIAAILLTQFIIAEPIGLRSVRSLRDVIGVSTTIICTLPIAAILDWLLLHTVLQPFNIAYLRLFIGVTLTTAMARLVEAILRSRIASIFPPVGSISPLTMTTCCTLIAAQIMCAADTAFFSTLCSAIGLSIGAVFLLFVSHTLHERSKEKSPKIHNGLARDLLSAVFILVALSGVMSIWQ